MKTKFLLFLIITILVQNFGLGQFLPSYYHVKPVALKNVQSGMYMESNPAAWGTDVYQNHSNVANGYLYQGFTLENGVTPNFYRLKHVASGKYVTVIVSPGYAEMRNLGDCPNTDYQEFKFVQQPTPYWYKLQAHFSHNGLNEVLCIDDGAGFDNGGIRLQPNKVVGNDTHQRWYITNLEPPVRPSDAIPTLEDRYEGRTVGLTDNLRGFAWRGTPDNDGANSIYATNSYPEYTSQFSLDYTDEAGWYRIRHKTSNKWVTINGAYDGSPLELQNNSSHDRQKFKFIWKANGKYEIHSKFTRGPELGNSAALLLQVHPTNAGVQLYLGIDNTAGSTSDGWQLFDIVRYVNPAAAAEFDGGAAPSTGKIEGKQYHISARETLAMLEPYIVGSDTFVRIQQNPVYGEQSEWIFDVGGKENGIQYHRIRYGKTGQYLYMPVSSENANEIGGIRLILKTQPLEIEDKRYEFDIRLTVPGPNWCYILSRVGNVLKSISTNDDGFLEGEFTNTTNFTYFQHRHFCINLSMPTDARKTYAIVTSTLGHFLSDSGVKVDNHPLVHAQYPDYTTNWRLIPSTPANTYHIKNELTGYYLSARNNGVLSDYATTQPLNQTVLDKWKLERKGNYFLIKLASEVNGKEIDLGIEKGTRGGGEVFTRDIMPGELGLDMDFMITRTDYEYLSDAIPLPVQSASILDNYEVGVLNALNNDLFLNKMMMNLGLPFEPSIQTTLFGTIEGNKNLANEGFATSGTIPSFLPVIKSALIYTYNFSSGRADSALRNYKLDTAGHRVDITNALKKYIIEYLAPRTVNSWTTNETALINWLERKVKAIRVAYGHRLDNSWKQYKIDATLETGALNFLSVLEAPNVNTSLFGDVDYYDINDEQQVSIMEYTGVNRYRDYKSPGVIAALTVPNLSGAGLTLLGFFIGKQLLLAKIPAQVSAKVSIEVSKIGISRGIDAATRFGQELTRAVSHAVSLSNVATVVSVIQIATQILVMRAMEVSDFMYFENELNDKVNRCINNPIVIKSITQSSNLMEKIALNQDLDYLFAIGQRFDEFGSDSYTFTGSGNWNVTSNWLNNRMPPATLPEFGLITIDGSGECILNVPLTIPGTGRLIVRPNKQLRLKSTLTVPNLKIIQ